MPEIEPYTDEELDELEDINRDGWGMNNQYAARLLATVRKYKAVVDRLPKDAEGNPVVLGDNRYAIRLGSEVVGCGFLDLSMEEIDCETAEYWGTVRSEDGAQWRVRTTDTYTSREAAEAALQATNAESHDLDKHDYTHWADDNEHGDR